MVSRLRYSLVAGITAIVIFAVIGGHGGTYQGGAIEAASNPVTLLMLIPVVLMLFVSTKTRNIFAGILVGLFFGTAVGLGAGILRLPMFLLTTQQIMPLLVSL